MADQRQALELLVQRFSEALLLKLFHAEAKHGWDGAWEREGWREDLRRELLRHVDKGDPLDVAAYAAFAWHHGWSIGPDAAPEPCSGCGDPDCDFDCAGDYDDGEAA